MEEMMPLMTMQLLGFEDGSRCVLVLHISWQLILKDVCKHSDVERVLSNAKFLVDCLIEFSSSQSLV